MIATDNFPTRRQFDRDTISFSADCVTATLSNKSGDKSKFWLQIKNGENLHASTRSSIFRTPHNFDQVTKYLGAVCGIVNAINQTELSQYEKEDCLISAVKNMASIDYFKSIADPCLQK
ncbi:MAG: hypothetical protein WCH60_00015 [Burkholderiales bacterium]|jgi:hypothetical protein